MARPRTEIQSDSAAGAPRGGKRARKRISIYLRDDGTPDIDSLTDEQRAAIGLTPPADEPTPEPVPVEFARAALTMLANIEAVIVARAMDVPHETAVTALSIPPMIEQPMCEAASRVLTKYSGTWSRWSDEIMLAGLIGTWQLSAFRELRSMKAEQHTEERYAPRPAPVAESPQTEPAEPQPDYILPET